MKYLKVAIDCTLAMVCAYMLFSGMSTYFGTLGQVQGSEFGMLITLINQLSLVMIWLALFALRSIIPEELRTEPSDSFFR